MEAKDTVMSKSQVNEILKRKGVFIPDFVEYNESHPDYKFCLAQAEISFKAGIKEVVDWIEENNSSSPLVSWITIFRFQEDEWLAKLKEWGITP